MSDAVSDTLLTEYDALITQFSEEATDDRIEAELTASHDWTEEGARCILMLSRTYGTSILRNACALAAAMKIEDGTSGL